MSNAAKLAIPGVGDGGKAPVYDEANDEWDLALPGGSVPSSAQTASYTLALSDAGKAVTMTVATANTVTVPPNSTAAFPVGTVVGVEQLGAGTTTVAAGAGVTLRSRGNLLSLAGQYAVVSLRKLAADEWIVTGDLA